MITKESAQERVEYAKREGLEKTLAHFKISLDSLERYARLLREDTGESLEEEYKAKILVLDIETSPILMYTWTLYKPRLNHYDIYQDWHMFSWAAKWLLDDEVYSDVLTPEEARDHNDARIAKSLWEKVNEADMIIAHNGKDFDVKKFNARFMLNGIKPPSPYRIIDTLFEIRKVAGHTSNKLDFLAKLMTGEGKLENPRGLWKDCFWGDPEALAHMEKYNREDVFKLEDVYLFIRPWIKGHPNVSLYSFADESRCITCGSKNLYEESIYTTNTGMYRVFRCNDCQALSRARKTMLPAKNNKVLLAPIPR
jgi:hypothetical protein